MYVEDYTYTKKNGRTYRRVLMRTSYRKGGKVLHKTVGNLTQASENEIEAIRIALKHKDNLYQLEALCEGEHEQSKSIGAVASLYQVADRLGIVRALGHSEDGKRALWLVLSRFFGAKSRLSAVRSANIHAAREITGMESFNEDDLYDTLSWLGERREAIEGTLFRSKKSVGEGGGLYLYDVTSTYLEGEMNELGEYGYNRDGKRGKKQIVYGLLCDGTGDPVAVRAFAGNTPDHKTVEDQVKILSERFGCKAITFVGDKGMVKGEAISVIGDAGFHMITSIGKAQIRKLMKDGYIQLSFFDEKVMEVEDPREGFRYILRKNPVRADLMRRNREDKIETVMERVKGVNEYLSSHKRAKVETHAKNLRNFIGRLKIGDFLDIEVDRESGRRLKVVIDEGVMEERSMLDGCYCIKTDLPKEIADCHEVHNRYLDLSLVETAFKVEKSELEVRPVYLRNALRTQGHLLVVMLAYKIERFLRKAWESFDLEVKDCISSLSNIVAERIIFKETEIIRVPKPDSVNKKLLAAIGVELPVALPRILPFVATRKKLSGRRKK